MIKLPFFPKRSSIHARTTKPVRVERIALARLNYSADLPTRLAKLDAESKATNDAPLAMKAAHLAVAAAQQSQANHAHAAQLVYMADLRISIAEADAREILAFKEHNARAAPVLSTEGTQQRAALNTWEDEGGAPLHLGASRETPERSWWKDR